MLRQPIRPTMSKVRNAIFSIIGPNGAQGVVVADMYAGTGSFGIEALKRGCSRVDFVEQNAKLCRYISLNCRKTAESQIVNIYESTIQRCLHRMCGPYNLVFMDPPYGQAPFQYVLSKMQKFDLFAEECLVFIEHSTKTVLPEAISGLHRRSYKKYGDTSVTLYTTKADWYR